MGFFKDNASDLISAGSGIISTLIQNAFNVKQQQRANAHNREMVELQNAAAAQESEKAYQRSTPINQIGNMRAAGMSFAGAVNALNGGGSYQPAPVNSAQDTAPQVDLSGISNALQGFAQLKQQRELADKQLKAAKEQQQAQFAENAKQREHDLEMQSREHANTNRNADNRLAFDREQFDKLSPYQIREIEASIDKIKADTSLTEKQEEDLAYRLAEYKSVEYKSVRDVKNLLEGLQADFDYKITNKSFQDYLNENYDYDEKTGEYVPKKWHSNANKVQQGARTVWNTIFEIIPVNPLLEALGGTVENATAIKKLSKLK